MKKKPRPSIKRPSSVKKSSRAPEVTIFEVGPRDGLQNEAWPVMTEDKINMIQGLVAAGVKELEIGAFVREDRVPRMADTALIYEAIHQGTLKLGDARPWSLVPNMRGLERAMDVGAKNIAVFTAATESFVQANIGMSIEESLKGFEKVVREARKKKMLVRAYISTAFGCPFEGKTPPQNTLKVIGRLIKMDVEHVCVGDTIGVATPSDVDAVMRPAIKKWGAKRLAVHFHDTRGTALANALRAYQLGIRIFDSSMGGLGGCPFAPGAAGNLATEDLLYMFKGMGVETGIDLEKFCQASLRLSRRMNRLLSSKYLRSVVAGR